ncbi:MAG: tyrosine--tRNA ligase [Maricaulis sp.]|jgi:tyrosyl-tRNA synthetase|nr:tyrosine--tRNA ligase [Maricaulis sp.]MDG2043726.1 tyrosine--tRNA ligase [Maricaulis sp.]
MSDYKSDLVRTLVERGYHFQSTDLVNLDTAALGESLVGYIGFDATGSSLHVGSLVQIMMLRRMQQAGIKPIILMGGGTTKIGDPSGKDKTRSMLTSEQIDANKTSILTAFAKLLTIGDGPTDAVVVDNDEWLSEFGYLEFLRLYGPHFTINRMMTFESVKMRLEREQPLTFLEFNYMLLQAVDFLELNRRYNCTLQLGGGDQWGNIINGVELCRRVDRKEVHAFTTPLITTASGAKMGKTAEGAVWLNSDMLSAYDYWQFWRNTEDADVGKFLRLFTDLPMDDIAKLESLEGAQINEAKIRLANETTTLLHGAKAAKEAEATATATFAQGGAGASLPTITVDGLETAEPLLISLFVETGLAASNGEMKRHIKAGAAKVNGQQITDPRAVATAIMIEDGAIKLSIGKKKHALVRAG